MSTSKAALEHKEKGNAAFKAQDFPTAIGHYSAAMIADPQLTDLTFALNRAAAYLKLQKNEDAERDCSMVLTKDKRNVKALFRRAQARSGLDRMEEAENDLKDALKYEPKNDAVQAELQALQAKAREVAEKKKQKTASSSSSPDVKRRRVPITIVEPPAASSSSSLSSSSAQPSMSTSSAKKSFQSAKEERASTRPSRVVTTGGGIFKASGETKMFPTRTVSPQQFPSHSESNRQSAVPASVGAAAATTSVSSGEAPVKTATPTTQNNTIIPRAKRRVVKPPMTLFEFTRSWERETSSQERWSIFSAIPPESLPALFQASLEPSMLVAILEVFQAVLSVDNSEGTRERIKAYMVMFAQTPRFETVSFFLSEPEQVLAMRVWEAVEAEAELPWRF